MKIQSFLFSLLFLILTTASTVPLSAQVAEKPLDTKEITVEDIWQTYTFFPKSVPGFKFQKTESITPGWLPTKLCNTT